MKNIHLVSVLIALSIKAPITITEWETSIEQLQAKIAQRQKEVEKIQKKTQQQQRNLLWALETAKRLTIEVSEQKKYQSITSHCSTQFFNQPPAKQKTNLSEKLEETTQIITEKYAQEINSEHQESLQVLLKKKAAQRRTEEELKNKKLKKEA